MRKKSLLSIAGVALLSLASFAGPAAAQNRNPNNNVQGSTGGVNVCAGDTCVEKIGDDAHAEWIVQGFPLASSSNHGETSNTFSIYIPDALKDLKITAINMPVNGTIEETEVPMTITEDNVPTSLADYQAYLQDPTTYTQNAGDGVVPPVPYVEKSFPSYFERGASTSNSGTVGNAAGWHAYDLTLPLQGVTTFRVEGTVTTQAADTYIPIRATNKLWKCNGEGGAPCSFEQGCQSILDFPWGTTGDLPKFSMRDQATIDNLAKLYQTYGNDGFYTPGCTPTRNYLVDTIGNDYDASTSAGQTYAKEFRLWDNRDINYTVPMAMEDGCDQAMFHITICDHQDPQTPSEPANQPGNVVINNNANNNVTNNVDNSVTNNETTINNPGGSNGTGTNSGARTSINIENNATGGNAEANATGGNAEANAEANSNAEVNNTGVIPAPAQGTDTTSPEGNDSQQGTDTTSTTQTPASTGSMPAPASSKDSGIASASGDSKPVTQPVSVKTPSSTSGSNLADTSKTESMSKAEALAKSGSASPSRGTKLANTGANGTTIASLIAAGLLAVAAGAFMVRRKRES